MSDTKISDAVAWQYREDARHNGFDDDAWFDCTRELFNELSAIIGARQLASVARGDGKWREDEDGWPTQVRALYDQPQPADLSFDVEAMLAVCVPGGSIVDPQVVADNIRAWFANPAELAEQQGADPVELQIAIEQRDRWRRIAERNRNNLDLLAATGRQQGIDLGQFPNVMVADSHPVEVRTNATDVVVTINGHHELIDMHSAEALLALMETAVMGLSE